ncbi:hypothetical protein D5W64_13390 [Salmonella enterica subsp. enterica serovar Saintpaul]|nr:hypothetical protein [Salmonella enterica subsp. enterica serovar Saintpaul]
MTTFTLQGVHEATQVITEEVRTGLKRNVRTSHSNQGDNLDTTITFSDVIGDKSGPFTRVTVYVNESELFSTLVASKNIDDQMPNFHDELYRAYGAKLFQYKVAQIRNEILELLSKKDNGRIDIGWDHWVKTEISRRGIYLSYGDSEGTLMSTPVDDVDMSLRYLISSLNHRSVGVPILVDSGSKLTVDLHGFRWKE